MTWLVFGVGVPVFAVWLCLDLTKARELGRVFCGALAAAIGVGLSSILWWALLHLPLTSPTAVVRVDAVLWMTLGVIAWFVWRSLVTRRPPQAGVTGVSWPLRLAVVLLLLAAGIAVFTSVIAWVVMPHGSWDAWAIWNARARFLYLGFPGWREALLHPASHPDYPLLLPITIARMWTYLGQDTTLVPSGVALIFTAVIPTAVGASIASRVGLANGLLAGAFILATPSFLEFSATQIADVPFAAFVLLTLVVAMEAYDRRDATLWSIVGVTAGLAAWTKNEGILFVLVFVVVSFVTTFRHGGPACARRSLLAGLAGAAPVLLAVALFKWSVPQSNDIVRGLSASRAIENFGDLSRVTTIATAMGRWLWFGGATVVGTLPLVAAYAIASGAWAHRRLVLPACFTVAGMLAGYFAVYVMTPHDLSWHLGSSAERVVLHVTPALIWMAMLLTGDRTDRT